MESFKLNEIMPLFGPVYSPDYLVKSDLMLKAIKNKQFTFDNNLLAQNILNDDQGDYNAWYLKKMYLLSQDNKQKLIEKEMDYVDSCLKIKVKGFQVWEQRRFLTQLGYDITKQLQKTQSTLLEKDHKNYHAWSYRVWLANYGKLFAEELLFAEKMISKDVFNNSAWNHLYFSLDKVVQNIATLQDKKTIIDKYISYALSKLSTNKGNKANWNFIRGLFPSIKLKNIPSQNKVNKVIIKSFDQYPQILQQCTKWWNDNSEQLKIKPRDSLLVIQRQILTTFVHIHSQKQQNLVFAKNICQQLKIKQPQKANYWDWIKNNL